MKPLIEQIKKAHELADKSGYKQLRDMLKEMLFYASGLHNGLRFFEGDCGCEEE
jgi:hypothetical protein|tara:strand:+ start:172 stop:333 length:162 start_codon:yes stop_codon:yes gene_type:complete